MKGMEAVMIKIAIVEDENVYVEQLQKYLKRYAKECDIVFEITVFADGDEIAFSYKSSFDIILLDIQMRFMDGMTAAEHIREADPEVVIIFITNMSQYAIRGYAVDALDYVLKPVNYLGLCRCLDKAVAKVGRKSSEYIAVHVKGGVIKLEISKIYYIESQRHTIYFNTSSGEYSTLGTMKDIEEKMKKYHFFRINKGCLVNFEHVEGVQEYCAIIHGKLLSISRSRKNAFMEALTNYVSEVVK